MTFLDLKTDFSAVGDGVADDTAELQAALDDTSGKPIFIPAGTYKITDDVVLALADKEIRAAKGAVLQFASTKGMIVVEGGFILDGLSFVGTGLAWQQLLTIIGEDEENPICGFLLTNLNFDTAYGDAILPRYAHHGFMENIHVKDAGYAALAFESCEDWDVRCFNACDINTADTWGEINQHSNSYGIYSSNQVGDPISRRINVDGFRIINNPKWAGVDTHGGEDITYKNGFIKDCMYACSFGVGDSGQVVRPVRPRLLDTTIVYSENLDNDSIVVVSSDEAEVRGVTVYGGGKNHANYGVLKYYDNKNLRMNDLLFVNPALNHLSDYNSGNTGTMLGAEIYTKTTARSEVATVCGCGGTPEEDPEDPEEFQVPLVTFDGTNDYMTRATEFTGNANSKKIMFAGVIKHGDTSVTRAIYATFNGRVGLMLHSDGCLRLDCLNTSGSVVLRVWSDIALDDGDEHHFVITADLAAGWARCRIDGADHIGTGGRAPTIVNDNIDHTDASYAVGAATAGGSKCAADLGYLYMHNSAALDIDITANYEKFWKDGAIVDLGVNGELPAGQPILFLPGDETNFWVNAGSGGNMALQGGGLGDGGLYPI
jgi:hypothetical protein